MRGDGLLDFLTDAVGMRTAGTRQSIQEPIAAVHLVVPSDFVELLAGISHYLAGLADVSEFRGQL
jgi:hypothetical protein